MSNPSYQMQMVTPITRAVKWLVIANVAIWVVGVLILQGLILRDGSLFLWFGLIPERVVNAFWFWQPITYMFIHSQGVMHVVFNMLMLWWLGSELEARWGSRFFLIYYFVSGIGAAAIYMAAVVGYFLVTNNFAPLTIPVVGASGAIFGLLVAYGILFGERLVFFMMLFPMKARYFVMLLGGIEIVMLLESGFRGEIANLAHLGGIISGFLFLWGYGRYQGRKVRRGTLRHGRQLKLVVDNEKPPGEGDKGPRYWN
jgi:membrane associated rhomboid family serine protease